LRRVVIILITVVGSWASSLFAQIDNKSSIHFSTNGDTAYFGRNAMVRSNGNEHPSTYGALLGTAPQGTVASVTWGPETRLTFANDSQYVDSAPIGAIWENTLLVTFSFDETWANSAPFLMKSTDAGESWSDPWCITNPDTADGAYGEYLRLNNNNAIVAGRTFHTQQYPGQNIYLKKSTNGGITWGQPHFFFSHSQGFISWHAGTANGDSVIFIFRHGSDDDNRIIDSLKVSHSFNDGTTWSPALNVFYHQDDAYFFFLRYSMGKVHLVYQDYSSANTEIFYSQSSDWGVSWSDPIAISDNMSPTSQWPYLFATADGRLIISWYDFKYGSGGGGFTGDILYRISLDNGDSWGSEMRLTNNSNASASCSFIIGNQIGIIWQDHRSGFFTPELYYAESSDMGQTWSEEVRLTNAPGLTDSPALLVWNNILYLFWMDARNDPPFNEEIYFRKAEVLTGIQQDEERPLPDKYMLSAYPNPFNSSTTLTISNNDKSNISIFDITGRLVTSLHADQGKAVWNAVNIPSGLYFARAAGENVSKSLKLILLK
jgi:hypothetical protein